MNDKIDFVGNTSEKLDSSFTAENTYMMFSDMDEKYCYVIDADKGLVRLAYND